MFTYEDYCVGCDLPCINCGRKKVPVLTCDKCGTNCSDSFVFDSTEGKVCIDCFEKFEVEEIEVEVEEGTYTAYLLDDKQFDDFYDLEQYAEENYGHTISSFMD